MANTTLTPSIVAKTAVRILENELVMAGMVYRGYEDEFDKKVNGYSAGDTITIRKPTDFTVRDGAVMASQDVTEGRTTITVDKQKGVDFAFTSKELTLNIDELAERVIKPAMVQLANQIDLDVMAEYKNVPNWVGTPGQTVDAFADFAKAPTRMDLGAVPQDMRSGVLSPTDYWAMAGSQTALYMQNVAQGAYRKGRIGEIGGIDTYMSQNVPTHIVGPLGGTPLVNGAAQGVTYAAVKDIGSQSLVTDGWTAAVAARVKAGDVFTIAGVFDVNPVTKATLPHLKMFVVKADAASDAAGNATLTISPPIITSGAFQTVSAVPADNAAMTFFGAAGTGYAQNLVFHKNAFALVVVPLVKPPGAVDVSRETYKNINARVIPVYDGTNDKSAWRLDILYGVKTVDPRLAVRLSGS
ncbi:P22 phage major capsid protein family protein [Bosea sp. 685]|uniref:P22 phage major capsid protein family protein n=1 Tax=Bosea sp. 685 TaxID=3080057 RepID=UPI0028937358|nr:P22 phage major capsid protein family protein [Bosea sp. 685]WNJ88469.1 P22 phage major capsid protein family protein [Bosea sp. 685]